MMKLGVKKKPLRIASLFSGIVGFELGFKRINSIIVFSSEIDKFAKESYRAIFGKVPNGNISEIESNDIPNHDILTAGFPCQAFSVAGKGAGMAYMCECGNEETKSFDEYADRNFDCMECGEEMIPKDIRGLMFFEVARVMRDKKPKVALLENVKGLVGYDKGRPLDIIVETLSDIGYVIDFEILNSKYFGVPQNRERIFIVAVREDLVGLEEWNRDSLKGSTVIPKGKRRISKYRNIKKFNFKFPRVQISSKLTDVLQDDVPIGFYVKPDKILELLENLKPKDIENILDEARNIHCISSPEITYKNSNGGRIKEGDESFALTVRDRHGILEKSKMGVTYNRKDGIKGIRDISLSLSASDWRGLNRNQDQTAVLEIENLNFDTISVRRLTPNECWRLQGIPDEVFKRVEKAGISNSQLYKQAGNAVTVPVIEELAKSISDLLEGK